MADGGYLICKNFVSGAEGIINVGINGYDNLGCTLSTLWPLANYQYDCTNPTKPQCATNNGRNLFNFACIGETTEKNGGTVFHSMQDILKNHDLVNKHIFMKIDCEGGEYPGFKSFPMESLKYVDQIVA